MHEDGTTVQHWPFLLLESIEAQSFGYSLSLGDLAAFRRWRLAISRNLLSMRRYHMPRGDRTRPPVYAEPRGGRCLLASWPGADVQPALLHADRGLFGPAGQACICCHSVMAMSGLYRAEIWESPLFLCISLPGGGMIGRVRATSRRHLTACQLLE